MGLFGALRSQHLSKSTNFCPGWEVQRCARSPRFCLGWKQQTKAMRNSTPPWAQRPGVGQVQFSCWSNHRLGGRPGGWLNQDVKLAIDGAKPLCFDGDVFFFENRVEFLVVYSEYERHISITNQDEGDPAPARWRDPVDSAPKMTVCG